MIPYWAHTIDNSAPFSFEAVYRFPVKELRDAPRPAVPTSVLVIGAGIAGLTAALELEALGYDVTILEQSDVVGGRVRTHHFRNSTHGELGAMRIPGNHACTLHYVKRFGLKTRQFVNYNGNGFYLLRGQSERIRDWRSLRGRYNLSPGEGSDPGRLIELQMERALARLSASEKYQLFHSRTPGIVDEYDNRTLRQHLESGLLSSEAIEFLGHSTGLIQYERASFLETLIDYFGLLRVDQFELTGGTSSLTEAMFKALKCSVKTGHAVTSVSMTSTGVSVVARDSQGNDASFEADRVICTVPARNTASISWTPALDQAKLEACRRLYYASSAKMLISVNKRVWETDQQIFGGGSFSDEPFQQCWYPSDNAIPIANVPLHAVITGNDSEESATTHAPSEWAAANSAISDGPGVLTASYTWENNARFMASLTEEERTTLVLRSLDRLHPGISGHIDEVAHVVWDDEAGTGGGAFAYYAPGEHGRYLEPLCQPHPVEAPRVWFAGEHVSVVHAWMQGSIQSGLQAVLDLTSSSSNETSTTMGTKDG